MRHDPHFHPHTLYNLQLIEDQLWRSTGERTLQELRGAFSLLERALRSPGLMVEDYEAWNLEDQLDKSFVQAMTHLPETISRVEILAGFTAVRTLTAFACPRGDLQGVDPASLHDHRARLRIFKNSLESAHLQAEIDERATNRRDALLVELASLGGTRDASASVPSRRVAR